MSKESHHTKTLRRVLIVYKKSSYESHVLDAKDTNYLRLMREGNRAIRKSKSTHDIHMETLQVVKENLRLRRVPFDVRLRYQLKSIRGYDLVLTIGGDGTFLETSHHLEEGILLGINSVPKESVGYFCHATAENFWQKIEAYLKGRAYIQTLHRLVTHIDGRRVGPLVLNDVLFANVNPAGTTRYLLKIGSRQEDQKSSGLWISPAAGSTAGTQSAGGRPLPLHSQEIQYVVREPYAPPRRKKYRLLKGVLSPRSTVEILSMMDDAVLFFDGPHLTQPIRRGSRVVVSNAQNPIRAIWSD